MQQITTITDDANQTQSIVLPDGTSFTITLYFSLIQQGWFFLNLGYAPQNFTVQGMRVCNSPNMLRQYRNLIPFGVACFSTEDREPSLIADFSSGYSTLYVLTATEVAYYEAFLSGQV